MSAVAPHAQRFARRARKLAVLRPIDVVELPVLAVLLLGIEIGLRTTRVDRVARALGVQFLTTASATDAQDALHPGVPEPLTQRERRWTNNAARLIRRWPLDATCLRRSLLLGWILRKRQPTLTLGVRMDNGEVKAHAWIRLGSTDLDPAASDYLPFGDGASSPSDRPREGR
ncbi:MAG: lasso peptide biosynthesis B2 protein [Acidimicrobiia bacterium]